MWLCVQILNFLFFLLKTIKKIVYNIFVVVNINSYLYIEMININDDKLEINHKIKKCLANINLKTYN